MLYPIDRDDRVYREQGHCVATWRVQNNLIRKQKSHYRYRLTKYCQVQHCSYRITMLYAVLYVTASESG